MAIRSRLMPQGSRVVRSRLRDLSARVRGVQVVERMGKWLDGLQSDLRGAARERLTEAGALAGRVARHLLGATPVGPRPVINATGELILPGAELPLAEQALEALTLVARDYSSSASEPAGQRASALRSAESLLTELTGAEAALVFTNPASAAVAVLSALAAEREVLVARAHVERLHDEFALTDAVQAAQAWLREIGTTARSSTDDYRRAINPRSALLWHSQPADYQLTGAVDLASLDDLVALAAERELPLLANLPLGALVPLEYAGASHVPVIGQSLIAGADLVLFRGDACVGGPCSAIVAGRRELVERIAAHPLAAALGADRLTLSALVATLRLYRSPDAALRSLPLVQLLAASSDNLRHRAERLAPQICQATMVSRVEVLAHHGWLTSARLPEQKIPSWCLRVELRGISPRGLAADLAGRLPAVWATADDMALWLNLRSVLAREDESIVAAFHALGTRPRESTAAAQATVPPGDVLTRAE